uniref:Uncharacterized protein n=1 Tax=Anguilla anguilla TaxID=7936 RepID=A0A0E9Q906_ANGAN
MLFLENQIQKLEESRGKLGESVLPCISFAHQKASD